MGKKKVNVSCWEGIGEKESNVEVGKGMERRKEMQ